MLTLPRPSKNLSILMVQFLGPPQWSGLSVRHRTPLHCPVERSCLPVVTKSKPALPREPGYLEGPAAIPGRR